MRENVQRKKRKGPRTEPRAPARSKELPGGQRSRKDSGALLRCASVQCVLERVGEVMSERWLRNGGDADTTKQTVGGKRVCGQQWPMHRSQEGPDLELMRNCQPSLCRPTGLGAQSGGGWTREGLNRLCTAAKTVAFSLSTGDPCSMPSSFNCGKGLFPKQFTTISKIHTTRCCLFITRNSSRTRLDKEECNSILSLILF